MSLGANRQKPVEFQAIVLACAEEGLGLYPLVEEKPTSLLPVANRPLLSYQLNLLDRAKFSSVLVVTFKSFEDKIRRHINSHINSGVQSEVKMSVDLIAVEDQKIEGTLDIIRQIKHKIFTDFIVISGDLVTEASIHHLADIHRIRDATVTLLLKEKTEEEIKKYRKEHKDNELLSYFGTVRDKKNKRSRCSRVVYRKNALADERISIPKSLLSREPSIEVRTDLADTHLYVFRHWVIDLLDEKHSHLSSIQNDFIPYLIKLQYRDPASTIPAEALQEVRKTRNELSNGMCASKTRIPNVNDLVRCFAFIVPANESYCRRADSVTNYFKMNHEIVNLPVGPTTPWDSPEKSKGSVIGQYCELGENVSLKDCVIGNHCKINSGAKLNRCILMDSVTVGANCTIQNSIICSNSIIEDNCNVNSCQIADKVRVNKSSRLANEAVVGQEENYGY